MAIVTNAGIMRIRIRVILLAVVMSARVTTKGERLPAPLQGHSEPRRPCRGRPPSDGLVGWQTGARDLARRTASVSFDDLRGPSQSLGTNYVSSSAPAI